MTRQFWQVGWAAAPVPVEASSSVTQSVLFSHDNVRHSEIATVRDVSAAAVAPHAERCMTEIPFAAVHGSTRPSEGYACARTSTSPVTGPGSLALGTATCISQAHRIGMISSRDLPPDSSKRYDPPHPNPQHATFAQIDLLLPATRLCRGVAMCV